MTPVHVQNRSSLLRGLAVLLVGFGLVGPSQAQPDAQRKAAADARQAAVAAAHQAQAVALQAQAAAHQATLATHSAGAVAQQAGAATQTAQLLGQQAAHAGQVAAVTRKNVEDLRARRKPTQEAEKMAAAAGQQAGAAAQNHQVAQKHAAAARQAAVAAAQQAGAATQTAQAAAQQHQVAAKQAQTAAQHAADEAQKAFLVDLSGKEAAVLTSAYVLLGTANSDYGGHKGRAMNSVESAIRHLDAHVLRDGTLQQRTKALAQVYTVIATKTAAINQGSGIKLDVLSDAQLRQARGVLASAGLSFVQNKQFGALGHVETAMQEIDLALAKAARDVIRGKEADVLTLAYVYLAAANHDYDGHRAAAMSQVESAINILNNNLLVRGSYQQKVQAMKRQITEGVAKELQQQQNALHEDQTVSDAQLMMASALIQRVALVMAQRNQTYPLMYLSDGLTEITVALTIR